MLCITGLFAQTLSLEEVKAGIRTANPVVKMYDSEVKSMDEAAKGARSWMPPQLGFGQFMTPYNTALWKKDGEMNGMGSVMFSAEQMIPNKRKLDSDEAYMKAMSGTEQQRKQASVNELVNDGKLLYYDWIVLEKRLVVLKENEQVLDFMIKNAEIRYKNRMEKLNVFYKAKAALGDVQSMQLMYESDITEKRIRLNSLMGRQAMLPFSIDTVIQWGKYDELVFDSALFYQSRSDLKAIDNDILLMHLKQETERQSLRPQFGMRYDHMIGFGGQPMQYTIMGMVKFPMAGWSNKMNKANIESLEWKSQALQAQKEMMVNEMSGMAYGMRNELELKKKQIALLEGTILPALKNNFKTLQLAYEQNTEELFMLYDAWETLNMKQMEYLDLMLRALQLQVTIDRLIEKP